MTFTIKEEIFGQRAFPFLSSAVRVKMFGSAGLSLFRQSLIVRISERIQGLCISECSGCKNDYRFAVLHPCQKLSLADRVDYFLPQVMNEALDSMGKLIELYQTTFIHPTTNFEMEGREFVQQLTAKQLFDRRYMNEDTAYMFEFDDSWYRPDPVAEAQMNYQQELMLACQEIDAQEAEEGEIQLFPKIIQRKAHPNVRNVDETERIADQPKKKKKVKK